MLHKQKKEILGLANREEACISEVALRHLLKSNQNLLLPQQLLHSDGYTINLIIQFLNPTLITVQLNLSKLHLKCFPLTLLLT